MLGFSISEYHDIAPIYEKLKQLVSIPLQEIEARKKLMQQHGAAYMAEGIVTFTGSRLYMSMADTDEIIDEALIRFERVFQSVVVK